MQNNRKRRQIFKAIGQSIKYHTQKQFQPNINLYSQKSDYQQPTNSTLQWLSMKKHVKIQKDQYFIDQYNCGYHGRIVVTGKLYITNKRICFYSAFNDKSIFFDSTFIEMPQNDILKIQKKCNAKIFDNSIQITRKNQQTVFLTSFVSRDKCYDLIINIFIKNGQKKLNKKTDYDYDTQFLSTKIKIQEFQYLIHSFSCGYANKINIMGRMFITNKRILFYSLYDQLGTLNSQTIINIESEEIKIIQKSYNALIFDNSILIQSKSGKYCFTSFFARDKAFYILQDVFIKKNQFTNESQIQQNKHFSCDDSFYTVNQEDFLDQIQQNYQQPQQNQQPQQPQQNQLYLNKKLNQKNIYNIHNQSRIKVNIDQFKQFIKQSDDINEIQLKKRELQWMQMHQNSNNLINIGQATLNFPGLTALKALRIFDSGQQFSIDNNLYPSFIYFFKHVIMKRKNLIISNWSPLILQFLNTSDIKESSPIEYCRQIKQIVKLQKSMIPFMPSQAKSTELQKLYLLSKKKYIIESFIQNSGAPYTDSFSIRGRRIVQNIKEDQIKITVFLDVIFVKQVFVKNIITQKTIEQSKQIVEKMFLAMKKHLRTLQHTQILK